MAMNLKEMIDADNAEISEARDVYNAALKAFKSVKYPIENKQGEILSRFRYSKNKEIENEHSCDCCKPKYYHDGAFTKNGVVLWTDADHPNDRQEEEFTWNEVEKVLTV